MLWRVEISYKKCEYDGESRALNASLTEFGVENVTIETRRQYFLEAEAIEYKAVENLCKTLLCDEIIEQYEITEAQLPIPMPEDAEIVVVRKKPGVMETVEASVIRGAENLNVTIDKVAYAKKYCFFGEIKPEMLKNFANRTLANDTIEEILYSDEPVKTLIHGNEYSFERMEIDKFLAMNDSQLIDLNKDASLSLNIDEMRTIQDYFREVGRQPTDVELQTIAQTWSEHCKHKTMTGVIEYTDETGEKSTIDNLLKTTVFRVTEELDKDWCLSVFKDNAGVIALDDDYGIAFKVETHNHPSALEPYGGAGTGIGGVIRDIMGTGLGAKPIMNTDVFCFAPPDFPREDIASGILHPLRIMKGVVAGVRDYGNRMGIPTSNGALVFHDDYRGNPLVFAGSVGVIPRDMIEKEAKPGNKVIVAGGRVGRDGLGGATFSSRELDNESEKTSSGAVQIGNPIEEKKLLDVLLKARDERLYNAITDCGAGGLSSACGEMGEDTGVHIELKDVPLKYQGLSPWEIWLSEAQERMVFSVPEDKVARFMEICKQEDVEATDIGEFNDSGKLLVTYDGIEVAEISMKFLHKGLPRNTREAFWNKPELENSPIPVAEQYTGLLHKLLSLPTIASKEAIVCMYDHEVQGGSVVKPFVGVKKDGPSDAAVIKPIIERDKAIVVSNGLCPEFSAVDPYWMAACAVDECIRNSICVGGTLERMAILDNFSWGNCNKPEQLGKLVKASQGLYDAAMAFGTPFVSGKDSLNNEFKDAHGNIISIPPTLLVSGVSVIDDVKSIVTSDFKNKGSVVLLVGKTYSEFGGSQLYSMLGIESDSVPQVRFDEALNNFQFVESIIREGLIRSAHDCSEGGLAITLAEMCIGGDIGCKVDISNLEPEDAEDFDDNE
ncbi:MAG: phosphoribosylformylglycinamidine synthase subunit PurL, partial [Planctomycetes bacterium]|nr:phosphoribosylformylglycinamidine synthase subunit PurL [Planctomycetota bacterium]